MNDNGWMRINTFNIQMFFLFRCIQSKSYSCPTGQKFSNSDRLPLLNLCLLPHLLLQPVLVAPLAHHLRLVFSIKLVFIKLIFSQSLPRRPFYTQADWEGCHGSWHSCSRHCGSSNHPRFSQSVVVMEKVKMPTTIVLFLFMFSLVADLKFGGQTKMFCFYKKPLRPS